MPKRFAWQWDVANEYFLDADPSGINPNDFWVANLGPGIIPQAFKRAHEVGSTRTAFN
jgi:endo-1,4-beta-xylanase